MVKEVLASVASSTVEALKTTPVILAGVVLNIVFLGVMFVSLREARKVEKQQFAYILNRCLPGSGQVLPDQ
jgi:hypothetical protein